MPVVCLCAMHYSYGSSAQPFLKGKQEVAIGYGYYTHEQALSSLGEEYGSGMTEFENSILNNDVTYDVFGVGPMKLDNRRRSGAVFVNYYFTPESKFSIGIGGGFESESADVVAYLPIIPNITFRHGSYTRRILTIAPEAKLFYNRNKRIRLYCLLGLGQSLVFETAKSDYTGRSASLTSNYWRFQLSPLGIMVGNRIRGFAELGVGYKGAVRVGASYKF